MDNQILTPTQSFNDNLNKRKSKRLSPKKIHKSDGTIEEDQKELANLKEQLEVAISQNDETKVTQLQNEIKSLTEHISQKQLKKKKKKLPKNPDTPESINLMLKEKCELPFEKNFHPPSGNKCCLVLDIDYTLFDHRWHQQVKDELKKQKSLLIPEFKRPYLHEFLTTCYQKYDIIIWSATGMTAIDSKCSNLGMYTNPNYKVHLVLSKDHMLFIHKQGKKSIYRESVKPLEVIWRNFPEYSPKNTIHIDDLHTNFQLNVKNGLQIQPFKEASKNNEDTELFYLTKYLLLIATFEDDFTTLNHSKWKEYTIAKLWEKQNEFTVPKLEMGQSKLNDIIKNIDKENIISNKDVTNKETSKENNELENENNPVVTHKWVKPSGIRVLKNVINENE